ncbi:MAG: hypothetical protein U9P00_14745 [Pseudomonadota bacterium]|nr:hypothetical protein [Pseudomonadota bacterium]
MIVPYTILVLGYAFLISLFLIIVISLKGKWILKFCMIPALLWFGLFLFYIPPQLAGYPSEQEVIEDKGIVRYFTYNPPTSTTSGHIYILVDTRFFESEKTKTFLDNIDPLTYIDMSEYEHLRLYKIPWDKELIKKMIEAKKQKRLIILRKNKPDSKNDKKEKRLKLGPRNRNVGAVEGGKGIGGTTSGNVNKYSVQALIPNEVFRKTGD